MDSQHRHELKENDLEHALRNFRQTWEKHGTTILVVILVVVLIFTGYRWLNRRSSDIHNTQWRDLAAASTAEDYQKVASMHDDPTVRSLALLYKGNVLLQKAATPQHEGLTPESKPVDPAERVKQLDEAAEAYKGALSGRDAPALVKLHATMGLATVAEGKSQWDDAKAKWKEVVELAGDKYVAIGAQAKGRIAFMDRLTEPVVFAPEPKPAPEPPPLLTPNKTDTPEKGDTPATPDKTDAPKTPDAKPDDAKPAPTKPDDAKPGDSPKKPEEPATPDASKPDAAKPDASKPAPAEPAKTPEKTPEKSSDGSAADAPKAPAPAKSPDAPAPEAKP